MAGKGRQFIPSRRSTFHDGVRGSDWGRELDRTVDDILNVTNKNAKVEQLNWYHPGPTPLLAIPFYTAHYPQQLRAINYRCTTVGGTGQFGINIRHPPIVGGFTSVIWASVGGAPSALLQFSAWNLYKETDISLAEGDALEYGALAAGSLNVVLTFLFA